MDAIITFNRRIAEKDFWCIGCWISSHLNVKTSDALESWCFKGKGKAEKCFLSRSFTLFMWKYAHRHVWCTAQVCHIQHKSFTFTQHTFPFMFINAVGVCPKRRPVGPALQERTICFVKCTPMFAFCFADVIHTVGPIARGNVGQPQKEALASCYKSSLKLVKDNSLRSVVSTGGKRRLYGFI